MSLHMITAWILEHGEIIGILAAVAAGISALYRPVRDLLKALPHFVWIVVKFAFKTAWFIIWPLRKMVARAYFKYAEKYVDRLFEKISRWFDKREIAKEKLRDTNRPIKPTEL